MRHPGVVSVNDDITRGLCLVANRSQRAKQNQHEQSQGIPNHNLFESVLTAVIAAIDDH
jgi:hypothetical protein